MAFLRCGSCSGWLTRLALARVRRMLRLWPDLLGVLCLDQVADVEAVVLHGLVEHRAGALPAPGGPGRTAGRHRRRAPALCLRAAQRSPRRARRSVRRARSRSRRGSDRVRGQVRALRGRARRSAGGRSSRQAHPTAIERRRRGTARKAPRKAEADGLAYVVLDGEIFSTDLCDEKATSVKGKQVDPWHPGKSPRARAQHPGSRGTGRLSAAGSRCRTRLGARPHRPRAHARRPAASQLERPNPSDGGNEGAGVHTPPAGDQVLDEDNRTYDALLGECGFALLTGRWRTLHHVTACRRRDRRHRQGRTRRTQLTWVRSPQWLGDTLGGGERVRRDGGNSLSSGAWRGGLS